MTKKDLENISFSIDAKKFSAVGKYVSKDQTRWAFHYVQLKQIQDGVRMMATDGYRAACWDDTSKDSYIRGLPDGENLGIMPVKLLDKYGRSKHRMPPRLFNAGTNIVLVQSTLGEIDLQVSMEQVTLFDCKLPAIDTVSCKFNLDTIRAMEKGIHCFDIYAAKDLLDPLLRYGALSSRDLSIICYRDQTQKDREQCYIVPNSRELEGFMVSFMGMPPKLVRVNPI